MIFGCRTILALIIYNNVISDENVGEDYEYEYDDKEVLGKRSENISRRLVGAKRADVELVPWIVGYSAIRTLHDTTSCSGSLISPSWILSAAHCFVFLLPVTRLQKCVENTKKKGKYNTRFMGMKCTAFLDGHLKMELTDLPGKVYLGTGDVNDRRDVLKGDTFTIDYMIRHKFSYSGKSSYGSYGGYDIALLHIATPAGTRYRPACIPGVNYKDTGLGKGYDGGVKVFLAGYGKYTRKPCLTDDHGPAKYHYCSSKPCRISPAPSKILCKKFFKHPNTPDDVPRDHTDLVIMTQSGTAVYCYPRFSPKSRSLGWCVVNEDASVVGKLKRSGTWGFCSKECYLNSDSFLEPETNVLRLKTNVDILDEELCNFFLQKSLVKKVQVEPEILCIGRSKHLNYTLWTVQGEGFKKVDHKELDFKHKLESDQILDDRNVYIHSAGICNGDSGGPVFVTEPKMSNFVVLGVVSGGRGKLGKCGGMNNPTHYARVKKFTNWIQEVVASTGESVCVAE